MTDLQTAISKIRAECKRVLEASEKATPGPWCIVGHAGEHDECGADIRGANGTRVANTSGVYYVSGKFIEDQANADLIALSRNFSPASAKGWLAILEHWHDPQCKCESCAALIEMADFPGGPVSHEQENIREYLLNRLWVSTNDWWKDPVTGKSHRKLQAAVIQKERDGLSEGMGSQLGRDPREMRSSGNRRIERAPDLSELEER